MAFTNGMGRRVLVNTICNVAAGFPSSLNFGTFLVSEFSGILGMVRVDSSQNNVAQLELNYLATSGGATLVSSSVLISSGGYVVNELNPGAYVSVALAAINSVTAVRVFLTGAPIR